MRTKPITSLELKAVTDNFRSFALFLKSDTLLRVWEDNQAVVNILNAMTSKSRELMQELRLLHGLLTKLGITIESRCVPSAVNRFAKRLSRLHTFDDWRINLHPLSPLLKRVYPTIDRFGDIQNTIFKRFNSEFASPGSLAIDALSQDWSSEVNFWNPPLKLLPLVAKKFVQEQAPGVLITPWWSAQSWCAQLLRLGEPTILNAPDLYLPPIWAPRRMPYPPWKLAVWNLYEHRLPAFR